DGAYSIIKTSLSELDVPELDSETAMNVYPNPATDHLNITTEEDITEIRVLNASGQVMLQKEINSNEYSLNVGNLDAGIYILQTTFKNRQSSLRFAVK
ncbi:MAG: T9SS type A sorting domain-containing protein, partial [Bacteroidota bacterium]